MDETHDLEEALRRLRTPMPSPALVEQVRWLAHRELAGRTDERLEGLVLAFLLVFSWTLTVLGYVGMNLVETGAASVLGLVRSPGRGISWSMVYAVAGWLSGAAVLVALGFRRRREGRFA